MVRKKFVAVAMVAALAAFGAVEPAFAVDAPKWVAALYVEVQRAVGLRWNPVPGATGYKVLRSETQGTGYQEVSSGAAPQYFDQKVEAGTSYFYVLQAVAGAEVSANSEEKSITIPGQKKVAAVAPEWVQVELRQTTEFGKTSYRAALSWVKKGDAVAYNVYRTETPGKDYQLLTSVSETTYNDATVQVGKTYYFTLTSLDGSFQESPMAGEKSVVVKEEVKVAKKVEKLVDNKLVIKTSKPLVTIKDVPEVPQLRSTPDMAVGSRGQVFIADAGAGRIHVFTANGEYQSSFGEKGHDTGKVAFPLGITVDSDDKVYIADRAQKSRIVVFTAEGRFTREVIIPAADEEFKQKLDPRERASAPMVGDVAVAADGRIFATDSTMHRVVVFDADGEFIKQFGEPGNQPGQLNTPYWCAINKKGELHICNGFNRRIEVFDLDGNFVRTYGLAKSYIGSFLGATGITFDDDGNSVVADAAMATIQFFDPEGKYLFHMGDVEAKIEPESKQRPLIPISQPTGIVYNPVNKAFFVSVGGGAIQGRQLTQQ